MRLKQAGVIFQHYSQFFQSPDVLDHRSLTEKDLRPPGSAEAPDREENSRSEKIARGRE